MGQSQAEKARQGIAVFSIRYPLNQPGPRITDQRTQRGQEKHVSIIEI